MAFLSRAAADAVPADNHQPPPLPPLKMDSLLDRTWEAQAWAFQRLSRGNGGPGVLPHGQVYELS